jgi:hypothetical protein
MTGDQTHNEALDEASEDIVEVYGALDEPSHSNLSNERQQKFAPWHHPVKQIVRQRQWAALAKKLLDDWQHKKTTLRYFTLPGKDLFDIKILSEICAPQGVSIEYFGFNSMSATQQAHTENSEAGAEHVMGAAAWAAVESTLRQAGCTTSDSVINPDRLEDIAVDHSHASAKLRQRQHFDIINVDVCDHLAYAPVGRERTTFDALNALLHHQMGAKTPWLLYLTTRADCTLLGTPGIHFQKAISDNLNVPGSAFGAALAECLDANLSKIGSELNAAWSAQDMKFLKLYTVGLGKFLLQFFCGQPNLPANVELASAYAYRVYEDEPDMLALAFRITPEPPRVFPPSVGGAAIIPSLEPVRAVRVAERAKRMWDIDAALDDRQVRSEAVQGMQQLLEGANYSIAEWREWLKSLEKRPLMI